MVFTEVNLNNGAYVGGNYTVGKPTTQDILQGSGALATGNSMELAIEAQICAAFNRHVMEDVTQVEHAVGVVRRVAVERVRAVLA